MIRIILVRHGRTAWNIDRGQDPTSGLSQGPRFRGIIDLPLAPQGVEQAQATARRLAGLPLEAIYCSPLQRAVRTAQILALPHGLRVQTLPGLGSMDYGAWAGRSDSEVAQEWPAIYRLWRLDPFGVQIPGGESTADLRARAVDAVGQILARHCHAKQQQALDPLDPHKPRDFGKQRNIVLVSHQVVIKTLVCALAGLPGEAYWRLRQDLCNLTRFDYEPDTDTLALSGLNDTCHLDLALPRARVPGDIDRRRGAGVRIILVRHGQTAWNSGAGQERFRGRTDLPLDQTGHSQANALAPRLWDEPIAAIYASPLQRTQQTVAPLAKRLGLTIQPDPRLLDIDYGLFQGLDHQEAAAAFPQHHLSWLTRPGQVSLPEGESLDDVRGRLVHLLDELAHRHRGQTVLLAGHQIVNKVLTCTLLGLDLDRIWHVGQDTTAISVFQQVAGAWHILRLNDTYHLAPANADLPRQAEPSPPG
jgi:broad specificity phosphatase PhoE